METSNQQSKTLASIDNQEFDLIVIGGGINGAAIARDAVLRGLSVCLLEKHSFAHGASANSSKLAHGGLRYLEHYQFRMVEETLRERDLLFTIADNYVTPLEFVFPIYHFSKRPFWKIKLGLWVYSFLAHDSKLPKHKVLSSHEINRKCPILKSESLKGGFSYFDGQLLDKELVLANISDAETHGAQTFEHSAVTGFIKHKGKTKGVTVTSNGNNHSLFAKRIINTTGAWTNGIAYLDAPETSTLVAPTKGVHIIVDDIGLDHALILETPQDKRIFFIVPWKNQTLIGTTDTPFPFDPDTVSVEKEDCDYLLEAANFYLKQKPLTHKDILSSFAGLRPLQYSGRNGKHSNRDFSLTQSKSGIIHLVGGKLTSYRHMAEVAVNHISSSFPKDKKLRPCQTRSLILP